MDEIMFNAPDRVFYVGYSFIIADGYGTTTRHGNLGLKFPYNTKKNMSMMATAKEFIAQRLELDTPDLVTILMFEELEGQ